MEGRLGKPGLPSPKPAWGGPAVLPFKIDGPGGLEPKDLDRQLRKPLTALDSAHGDLAAHHARTYCGTQAQDELLVIGTAALLTNDFKRRQPGRFRRPWQAAWEELCDEAITHWELTQGAIGTSRTGFRYDFDRWCQRWLEELVSLSPVESQGHASPTAARWARARHTLEHEIKQDIPDEPWVAKLADRLHDVGRGMVTGIAASTSEHVVVVYDGREVIDLPWPAQFLLWAQYPGGTRHVGTTQHHLTAVPRLFTLLDSLSHRSLAVIGAATWQDSPAVYQEAISNVPKAAFSPDARCWWATSAARRLEHLIQMARSDAQTTKQEEQRAHAPWR